MSIFSKTIKLEPESAVTRQAVRALTARQNALISFIISQSCVGMTTADVARTAREEAKRMQLDLSFRSFNGFPDDLSVSAHTTVINGVPDATALKQGDIVRLGLGSHQDGKAFSIQNWSYCIGEPLAAEAHLLASVHKTVNEAIRHCQPGARFSELAATLEAISEREEFHLSALFRGNQIGSAPFMGPPITAPQGLIKRDMQLVPGMFLSFFALGHRQKPKLSIGKWAVRDRNAWPAAIFSHMVEITEQGPATISAEYRLTSGR